VSEDRRVRGESIAGRRVPYRGRVGRIYRNREQFEGVYREMFDAIADDDGMDALVGQQMVIRFVIRSPDSEIWVDGRSRPVATTFGPSDLEATLTASLSADSMHELLLGTLPLGRALMFRKLKVSGSTTKAMRLEDLLHACQRVYPDLAEERLG
jgi:putative sterol carrier protein